MLSSEGESAYELEQLESKWGTHFVWQLKAHTDPNPNPNPTRSAPLSSYQTRSNTLTSTTELGDRSPHLVAAMVTPGESQRGYTVGLEVVVPDGFAFVRRPTFQLGWGQMDRRRRRGTDDLVG